MIDDGIVVLAVLLIDRETFAKVLALGCCCRSGEPPVGCAARLNQALVVDDGIVVLAVLLSACRRPGGQMTAGAPNGSGVVGV